MRSRLISDALLAESTPCQGNAIAAAPTAEIFSASRRLSEGPSMCAAPVDRPCPVGGISVVGGPRAAQSLAGRSPSPQIGGRSPLPLGVGPDDRSGGDHRGH